MAISLRIQGSIALLCLGAVACRTTPQLEGRQTQVVTGEIQGVNPADIAVAPVRYAAAGIRAPEAQIRRAAQLGLARRRYSPLSLGLVDETVAAAGETLAGTPSEGVVEASYAPGDLGEDAVLELTIERWDTRNWTARRSLDVIIEARMIDPADPFGLPLWTGRLAKVVDASGVGGLDSSGARALEAACNQIFRELFAKLPARDLEGPDAPDAAGGEGASSLPSTEIPPGGEGEAEARR